MHTAFGYRVVATINGNTKNDKLFCSPDQAWKRIAELRARHKELGYTAIVKYAVTPVEITFEN